MPLTRTPLSRRQWLTTSGLLAGGTVLAPDALRGATPEAPHVVDGVSTPAGLAAHAAAVRAERAGAPVRLASNENPSGMGPAAKQAIMGGWAEHNKYGNASPNELRAVYAKSVGVPVECVLVVAGSSESLAIAALGYGLQGGELVTPWPTYEGLPRYAEAVGAKVHRVPLKADFTHDLEAMDRRITQRTSLVFVCNPNNPTGTLTDNAALRSFVQSTQQDTMVVVDEAYHDFVEDPGYRPMVDMVLAGANVMISRTASKIHGLAGLRTGYVIARPDIIERLTPLVTSFPSVFGARGAIASVQDTAYQAFCRKKNAEGRATMTAALKALGYQVTDSHTNFVFFDSKRPTPDMQKRFEQRGWLVGRAFPPYNTWVRISIGTPEEMTQLAAQLPEILKA
jgi:histidinol-phosphate aminotransferase